MQRLTGVEEWLDQGEGNDAEIRRNFGEIERLNHWLGGWGSLRRHLCPAAARGDSVLDAGCGAAALIQRLSRWSQRSGTRLRIFGLDCAMRHLEVAREAADPCAGARLVGGNLLAAPFPAKRFDFVYATLVLHHFDASEAICLLQALAGLARKRVIVNDLVRDPLALRLFRWSRPLLARNRLTRHDGELSIRRAYTPAELRQLLDAAGFSSARVHADRLHFRMTGVIDLA